MPALRTSGIVLPVLLLVACVGNQRNASPTPKQVWDGIQYGLIFGILPDEHGVLQKCSFEGANDVHKRVDVDFVPPASVINNACGKLANGIWDVNQDAAGVIKKVYMFCYYSTVVPDSAICDARYGESPKSSATP